MLSAYSFICNLFANVFYDLVIVNGLLFQHPRVYTYVYSLSTIFCPEILSVGIFVVYVLFTCQPIVCTRELLRLFGLSK